MTRLICTIAAIVGLAGASTARAQGTDYLAFYSDVNGTTCFLNYTDLGVATVYIFQTGPVRSSAIQFSAITPACWVGATWLGDIVPSPFLPLGSSQDPVMGLSVATAGCKDLPIYIGSINHLVTDPSANCCVYAPGPVQAAEIPGTLQYVDCTNPWPDWPIRPLQPVGLTINRTPECPCELPLSTNESTWGQVKALYR